MLTTAIGTICRSLTMVFAANTEESPLFFTSEIARPLLHDLAGATGRMHPSIYHDFYDCYWPGSRAGFHTDRKFKVLISLIENEIHRVSRCSQISIADG